MSITGHRLAQYELQEQLGNGSLGEMWKARDLSFHRDVAVKIFYTDLQRSEVHFLTRLTNEGQALVALRHPNIIPVHEIKVSRPAQSQETTAYLVMEYIQGQTLTSYLRATVHRSLLPAFTDIIYLFTSLGSAVDYAHQQSIVHGNIKPSNILLNRHNTTQFKAGEPFLTDFGLTQLAGIPASSSNPLYISPEQAQGFPANNRSDIYTLGVLLYELCTGIVPFRDENPIAVMSQHIHRLPTPPTLINPNIPPALSEVILRAMAKDPYTRFPQASLLAAAVADTSSLQSTFYVSKQLSLDNGDTFNTSPKISSNTPPKISSTLGVARPYLHALPSKPLTSDPLQRTRQVTRAQSFSSPPSSQTKPLPAASVEPIQLPDTGKQTLPQTVYATDSGNSSKFKSLPSLPTMPSTSVDSTAPSTQPTARVQVAQPSLNTITSPRITAPQIAVPVSQAVQPEHPAAVPSYYPPDKQQQSIAFAPEQELSPSLKTRKRLLYQEAPGYIIFASLLVIILILGSAIGISLLINKNSFPSTANGPGHVFFQDDALGQNDQLRIDMQNIADPPAGKSYFAWLQDTTGQATPLGPLNVQNGHISFTYPGDSTHDNLLGTMQGLFITTVNTGSHPQQPAMTHRVYQASFNSETLAALKNILYQTPGLPNNGSVTSKLLNTIGSINDKASSISDSLDHDNALVIRQASRIIDLLDGSAYAAQSGDRPATVASELDAPIGLLPSPTQAGYLGILDQQLQHLQQISQNSPNRLHHIQNVENAIKDLQDWLQNLRTYDVQLLKATNLSDPAVQNTVLQLKQAATDSYTGRTIPPNTAPLPVPGSAGASQAYTEARYLATLDLTLAS